TIRARPKIVTVDGRQAIITIGKQVPVVQETQTGDNRSTFNISFVPVGITLNIKPRIGRGGEEVQMQVNAVVSNVETLNNVVSELSLVAPELNTREVSTIVRIPNHQSLILGGLISTELETRTYKIPLLGDLPFIGHAFRRTREIRDRTEIIIIITPHVAQEIMPRHDSNLLNPYQISDPYLVPLGSEILDNLDNVLFPGEYLIKEVDIRGIDISTGWPYVALDKIVPYSANDPVMLTLLQIIRKLDMVDNLRVMQGVRLPDNMDAKTARYHAEAFLIAYLRHLNNLQVNQITAGRRLLVPAFPIPQESFDEPELAWHTINYLAVTRANPLLTGLAETIRWLDEQSPTDLLRVYDTDHIPVNITGPTIIDPVTGLPISESDSETTDDSAESESEENPQESEEDEPDVSDPVLSESIS
ncbi:MAG TPA: type II and III secretion system protein, partial [Firmicutes bacterium]|nr:type II and III secretion system protein [Bacillota bacterium]